MDAKKLRGFKGRLNKYLEETSLDGYYIDRNRNQEIPMLKIAWGWESSQRKERTYAYLSLFLLLPWLAAYGPHWEQNAGPGELLV